jgi:hypothetical protein
MLYLSFEAEQPRNKGDKSNQVQNHFILTGLFFYEVLNGDGGKK